MDERQKLYREMIWRSVLTLVIIAGTLIVALAYVAFYAVGFGLFQKIVVVLIALIVACAVVSIIWMLGWSKYMNKRMWAKFREWKAE